MRAPASLTFYVKEDMTSLGLQAAMEVFYNPSNSFASLST